MNEKKANKFSFLIIAGLTIVLSLFLVGISGTSLAQSLSGFVRGSILSAYSVSEVLVKAIPLLLCGLSVAVGSYSGFTNIGAEGQFYMGAVATTVVGMYFPSDNGIVLLAVAFLFSFILGGIWAGLPGVLKAKYGISEVINTLMFNYIATGIVGILLQTVLKDPGAYYPVSSYMPNQMWLGKLISGTRLHSGLFLAILASVIVYILMFRTYLGFQIRAVGMNNRACLCSGINVTRNIIYASLISGGLSALAGFLEIVGLQHRLMEGMSPGYGYLAIVASILGKGNPFLIILSSIAIALIQVGAQGMQRAAGVPTAISNIILGLVILLVLIRPFIKKTLIKVGGER